MPPTQTQDATPTVPLAAGSANPAARVTLTTLNTPPAPTAALRQSIPSQLAASSSGPISALHTGGLRHHNVNFSPTCSDGAHCQSAKVKRSAWMSPLSRRKRHSGSGPGVLSSSSARSNSSASRDGNVPSTGALSPVLAALLHNIDLGEQEQRQQLQKQRTHDQLLHHAQHDRKGDFACPRHSHCPVHIHRDHHYACQDMSQLRTNGSMDHVMDSPSPTSPSSPSSPISPLRAQSPPCHRGYASSPSPPPNFCLSARPLKCSSSTPASSGSLSQISRKEKMRKRNSKMVTSANSIPHLSSPPRKTRKAPKQKKHRRTNSSGALSPVLEMLMANSEMQCPLSAAGHTHDGEGARSHAKKWKGKHQMTLHSGSGQGLEDEADWSDAYTGEMGARGMILSSPPCCSLAASTCADVECSGEGGMIIQCEDSFCGADVGHCSSTVSGAAQSEPELTDVESHSVQVSHTTRCAECSRRGTASPSSSSLSAPPSGDIPTQNWCSCYSCLCQRSPSPTSPSISSLRPFSSTSSSSCVSSSLAAQSLSFNSLPTEIILTIFEMLDVFDLVACSKVCARWKYCILTEAYWRRRYYKEAHEWMAFGSSVLSAFEIRDGWMMRLYLEQYFLNKPRDPLCRPRMAVEQMREFGRGKKGRNHLYSVPILGSRKGRRLLFNIMGEPTFPFRVTRLHAGRHGIGSGIGFVVHGKEISLSALHNLQMLLPRLDDVPELVSVFSKAKGMIYLIDYADAETSMESLRSELSTVLARNNSGAPLIVFLDLCSKLDKMYGRCDSRGRDGEAHEGAVEESSSAAPRPAQNHGAIGGNGNVNQVDPPDRPSEALLNMHRDMMGEDEQGIRQHNEGDLFTASYSGAGTSSSSQFSASSPSSAVLNSEDVNQSEEVDRDDQSQPGCREDGGKVKRKVKGVRDARPLAPHLTPFALAQTLGLHTQNRKWLVQAIDTRSLGGVQEGLSWMARHV